MPDDELQVSIMPRVTELQDLSRKVEEYGAAQGLPEPTVFVINLTLDELITNSVMHGFNGVGDPQININLRVDGDSLLLTVKDNGSPFDPTADSNPDLDSALEDRRIGGLGLHLVKSFASRVHYEYVDGQNSLTLEHDFQRASD